MKRIMKMLAAMFAVLAISAVGASAASALDGEGNVSIPSTGGCDVTFDATSFSTTPALTEIDNVGTAVGGTCDVDSVAGGGELDLDGVDSGDATFEGTFNFRVLSGLIRCEYTGVLEGDFWWTEHNLTTPVSAPPSGDGEDVVAELTGPVTRISGSALFCPASETVNLNARIHVIA